MAYFIVVSHKASNLHDWPSDCSYCFEIMQEAWQWCWHGTYHISCISEQLDNSVSRLRDFARPYDKMISKVSRSWPSWFRYRWINIPSSGWDWSALLYLWCGLQYWFDWDLVLVILAHYNSILSGIGPWSLGEMRRITFCAYIMCDWVRWHGGIGWDSFGAGSWLMKGNAEST